MMMLLRPFIRLSSASYHHNFLECEVFVLNVSHIISRFRYSFKSQELWTELKYVLDKFAAPLTELFEVSLFF